MFGRFRTYVKFSGLELFKNGDCPDTNGGLLVSPNLVKLNEGLMAKFKAVDGFGRLPQKRNAVERAYRLGVRAPRGVETLVRIQLRLQIQPVIIEFNW